MRDRRGASATGGNAGPERVGAPDAEGSDAFMGTTSGRGPTFGKRRHAGKPGKGSRGDDLP